MQYFYYFLIPSVSSFALDSSPFQKGSLQAQKHPCFSARVSDLEQQFCQALGVGAAFFKGRSADVAVGDYLFIR